MPYVPLRNGQSVFISDQQQAEQRYQQEWGGSTQTAPSAPKTAAASKPQAVSQAKPKQPKRGFDLGQFVQQQAGAGLRRFGEGAATQFLAGPLAPFVQMARGAQAVGNIPIPGTKTTVGKEAARVVPEAARKLVNDPMLLLNRSALLLRVLI